MDELETAQIQYPIKFNMNWNELQISFPKLIFLEKYKTSNAGVFEYMCLNIAYFTEIEKLLLRVL